jgi:hypothetical protein
MADGTGGTPPPNQDSAARGRHQEKSAPSLSTPSLQTMATDWITIWQSELAAMATDRELQEGWLRLVDLWAQAAQQAVRFLPPPPAHDAAGRSGPAAPAGPTPPVAAPDARDAALERLAARVEELERQLGPLPTGRVEPPA